MTVPYRVMATQLLAFSIYACETSAESIQELVSGCTVVYMGGTVTHRHADMGADEILMDLSEVYGEKVKRPVNTGDDTPSMVMVTVIVPDSERPRLDAWLEESSSPRVAILMDFDWGVAVGDRVSTLSPNENSSYSHPFDGTVIGFHDVYIQVEDQDGDVFDVEVGRTRVPHNCEH